MRDRIDERNFREMCSRSIVKSYNVHYLTKEEQAQEEAQRLLEQMKKEEEEKRRMAIENAGITGGTEELPQQDIYSSEDALTKEQIEKILGEREERIQEEIERASHMPAL